MSTAKDNLEHVLGYIRAPTSTSTKKAIDQSRSSSVRLVSRNSGAERFDSASLVKRGNPWTKAELEIIRTKRHLKDHQLQELLPTRSRSSINTKRVRIGALYRILPFTPGEDEEIKRAAPRLGQVGISRILPHRTPWEISQRAKALGIKLFSKGIRPLNIVGEPLADAIRKRAHEDGFTIRGLDCELGTGLYFTSCANQRAKRGGKPNMTAIRKAIEFFDAELVTGPDGTITIDWKDE